MVRFSAWRRQGLRCMLRFGVRERLRARCFERVRRGWFRTERRRLRSPPGAQNLLLPQLQTAGTEVHLCKNKNVVTFDTLAREKRPAIVQLADKYGARNLRVFGSVARGDNSDSSDVDLLVEFGKDRTLFDLIAFRLDLRDLLGVNVDIVTPGNLRYIRENVLAEARAI